MRRILALTLAGIALGIAAGAVLLLLAVMVADIGWDGALMTLCIVSGVVAVIWSTGWAIDVLRGRR